MKLRIRYNSPVILTFALLCAVVLLIDQISGGWLISTFFIARPGIPGPGRSSPG